MVTTPFILSLSKAGGVQNPAYRSAGSPAYTSTSLGATAMVDEFPSAVAGFGIVVYDSRQGRLSSCWPCEEIFRSVS